MNAANDIRALYAKAMKSGNVERATIEINGRQCLVTISPSGVGQQQPQIRMSYASLASRRCQVKFTYNEERIGNELGKFSEEITESEIDAMCKTTLERNKGRKSNQKIDGRECEVRVSPAGNQQLRIRILYAPPGSQEGQQVCEFIHKRGEPLAGHIAEVSKKALEIDEFKKTITSIANYPNQPIEREKINAQMREIGEMLEKVKAFAQQNPVSEADMSILKAALDALASASNLKRKDGKTHAINDCKDIATCRNVASQIEGLKKLLNELPLLLDAKASGIGSIVTPIVERLYQPIAESQVDVQMGEIGKMLGEVRTFVQQNSVSEAGIPVLKAALDKLLDNKGMIQGSNGIFSINGSKDAFSSCYNVALQIEGLKLLLDAKASGIGDIVAPIIERLHQPIPRDQIRAQMEQIGEMLGEVRTLARGKDLSRGGAAILKAALDKLLGNEEMIRFPNGNFSINECKGIPACRNVALHIEGLKLLLDDRANGVGGIVVPIVERLYQPIPRDQVDARMVEIGKMLEEVRTFVQQNPVSEAGMPVLKAALDRLASNEDMIQFADGYDSINGSDGIPACRKVTSQIEGLKLLLDAKASRVGDIVAPIIERLSQSIAEDQIDAQMVEIGMMLEGVKIAVQQNRVPEAGMPVLKAALDRLASTEEMIQFADGYDSINGSDDIPACRKVASQIEGLKLLLDAKANGVGDIVAPIIERLHQPIAQGQVDAQMGEIGTMLEGVRVAVQQNRVPVAGIPILRAALTRLAGNTDMIQWSNGNFSINECDNIPACRAVAMQIEELQILLDARANGQVNLEENIPPPMRELGKGCCNIVRLAHRGKGGQGPIALKPCDRAKSKRAKLDPDFAADFAKAERLPEDFLGTVSGSYRRNLAASGVQNIFVKIGALLGVEMPHVVANISAAEANGEACIAMEYLEGQTVGSVVDDEVRDKKRILIYDNEFIRHETWLQLMDILTGQVDRHGDNVMYTEDLPVGIDHDLSFPMNPPRNFAGSVPDRLGNGHDRAVDGAARRNYCMPPFIDGQMRDVIMALDLEELEAMYRECGLTRLELSAAMSRARALKSRVGALGQDQIIEPSAWEANEGRLGYDNSYAVRHYSGG